MSKGGTSANESKRKEEVSLAAREKMRRVLANDYDLYEYATQRLEKQLKELAQ